MLEPTAFLLRYCRSAAVSNYKVTFPQSVQWMSVEFDPRCSTAQMEDILQVRISGCNLY